jgi:arylsulfatase A-like enzyme
MNVVVIVSDTFRRDHLAAYGDPAPWPRFGRAGDEPFIDTPQLDRLSAQSAMFDRFYLSSYPTVPCRSDMMTGTHGFPTRGWQPLDDDDVTLAEILGRHSMLPAVIFDTPMLSADSNNFTRGFASWQFIRGHHTDRLNVDPIDPPLPAARFKLKNTNATRLYLRNQSGRALERDWMCARTMSTACDWLERNRSRRDFVLWVDTWDPHEPFDAPAFDVERYADPEFAGDQVIYPRYGRPDFLTDEEKNHIRALYAAKVTLVDRNVGRLLDTIERVGLAEHTLVIFTTDHGHSFGDHDLEGKPTGPLGMLYEHIARVPLLIRHPSGLGAGQRIAGIAQHTDLLPTILEFLGIEAPAGIDGHSLWPLITGERSTIRDVAVSGRYSANIGRNADLRDAAMYDGSAGLLTGGEPITITDERWSLILPARHMGGRELYDLDTDPGQHDNVIDQHPDVADRLQDAAVALLVGKGAPSAKVALYAGPQASPVRAAILADDRTVYLAEVERGRTVGFLERPDAVDALFDERTEADVLEARFHDVVRDHPDLLIHAHDQYYRAADLAGTADTR